MRRWLAALLLLAGVAAAQNPNPQQSYVQTVQARNPSMWLRFNGSSATSFLDQVSGLNFSTTFSSTFISPNVDNAPMGYVFLSSHALAAGPLTTVTIQLHTAPSSTCPVTVVIAHVDGGGNFTITDSFAVNLAVTTAIQTFSSGTDFSPRSVPTASVIGTWMSSSSSCSSESVGVISTSGPTTAFAAFGGTSLPAGSQIYFTYYNDISIGATTTAPGTVVPRQPGFDSTLQNNYSVAVPYNGWIAAPNGTIGDLEWSNPWSVYVHINDFVYNQLLNNQLILMSKGDVANDQGDWWELYINGNGLANQICFAKNGFLAWGAGNTVQTTCTGAGNNAVIPDYGLDITFSNAGTGWPNDDEIYINGQPGGLNTGASVHNAQNNIGFGPINVTASGGSGYTDPNSPFTSSGGGAHCTVTGTFNTSGGVATGAVNYSKNAGCSSVPTLIPGGTGTGVSITGTNPGNQHQQYTSPVHRLWRRTFCRHGAVCGQLR